MPPPRAAVAVRRRARNAVAAPTVPIQVGLASLVTRRPTAAAVIPRGLCLSAACGRAVMELAPLRLPCLLVPLQLPKTTRGWQPTSAHRIDHTVISIPIVDADYLGNWISLGTRLLGEIVADINWTFGALALGAAVTLQKRGPPPLPTGRGGR